MRKIILLMHVSLDGFVSGPNGEMDWIKLDNELWEHVDAITANADAAIFGENTFKMMEAYWPTAASKQNASKHDIDHAKWINSVEKIAFSNTRTHSDWSGTLFLKGDPTKDMQEMQMRQGKNLLMIGSPTLAHEFMKLGLIDEYYLNVNPIVLGAGKPLFAPGISMQLELIGEKSLASGVVSLQYRLIR